MSASGSRGAALERDPERRGRRAPAAISPSVRASPQPQSLAWEIAEQRQRRGRRRARPRRGRRRGPGVRIGRLGHEQLRRRPRRATRHDRAEPEDPVVGGVVDEQAAEDRPSAAADAERCAEIRPMLRRDRSRGNSSRMIPKQSGKMPPPAPCRTRPATTTPSACPSAETTEPAANSAERDHEQAALAEHVAEPAEERRADRGGEQVAGQRPGDAAGVGVQRARELGERRDQRRLRERERERGDAEDQQRADGVGARGVGGRHRRRWIASRKPIGDDPRNEP